MDKIINFVLFNNASYRRRYLFAGAYLFVLVFIAMWLGVFDLPESNNEVYIRKRNAAIGMPLFTVFIWLALTFIFFSVKKAIDRFSIAIEKTKEFDKQKAIDKLTATSIKNLKFSVLLGLITTVAYNAFENLLPDPKDTLLVFLVISAVPFWIACWLLVFQLYTITHHIINDIIKRQTIDLFGLKSLLPLSDQFITFIIVVAIIFALSPVFWIGKPVPLIDLLVLTAVFIFLSIFLFHPIMNIQSRIYGKKKLAIQRINVSIQKLLHTNNENKRRLTDDPHRLRQLSALINAKNEITSTSEWAISVPQQIRGVLIVISIPLSWVAASMIETGISQFSVF